MATNAIAETRTLAKSIKKVTDDDSGVIQFFFNSYRQQGQALPPFLPDDSHYGFYRRRDIILLSTPRYDSQWAAALGIAIAKMASMGWDIDSKFGNRRERWQNMFLEAGAGMGIFGWVPFLSMHLRSYLCTGSAFVEIERAGKGPGGRVINIHHLNPLRCRLTGNPKTPVNYYGMDGGVKELKWWQVFVIADNPDPTEGENGVFMSSASRAYQQIIKQAAIEMFIYEKVTGRRPLAINFVGGLTRKALDTMLQTAQNAADRKGLTSYMGAAVVPIPGDVPVSVVTIPIAELPDITDVARERLRSDLIYANSLGLDPQDINPGLIGGQGLGSTGNQSIVLRNKEKGRPLFKWRQDFAHQLNQMMDTASTFAFSERDLGDDEQAAKNKKLRAEVRKIQIDTQEITAAQARNLAVDDDDLPAEFLETDVTGGDSLRDDQKPKQEGEKKAEPVPAEEPIETAQKSHYNHKLYLDPDLDRVPGELIPQTAEEWIEAYH